MKRLALILMVVPVIGHTFSKPSLEVGFSPEGSARQLVLDQIYDAKQTIDVMAYSYQSKDIAVALGAAVKRGVRVRIIVDKHRNDNQSSSGIMKYTMKRGVEIRSDDHYKLQHDKVMIIDGDRVETGSFNFASSAEYENSENVMVFAGYPVITKRYQEHFESRWEQGVQVTEADCQR